jgi:hypothetical protein
MHYTNNSASYMIIVQPSSLSVSLILIYSDERSVMLIFIAGRRTIVFAKHTSLRRPTTIDHQAGAGDQR